MAKLTLLKKALSHEGGRKIKNYSEEEKELVIAYLQDEITFKQFDYALNGGTTGNTKCYTLCVRVLKSMFVSGEIKLVK